MNRIIKIGMDVHTTNYTLCIFEPSFEHDGTVHCITQVKPEVKNIIHVIETFKKKHENEELNIVCGYEAGCLGYSLYHELKEKGIECVILAPTTMKTEKGGRKLKNDYRDAKMIAECLAYGGYSAVHVPTELDNSVKEFIRMRDDIKENLKRDATFWKGKGGYENSTTYITYVALSKYELSILEKDIEKIDKNAFIITNDGVGIDGNFKKKI